MSKKIRVKLILRLAESGMSQNAIARLHHISKRSINDVLSIAKENVISFAATLGFTFLGSRVSPILGGDGNEEYLVWFSFDGNGKDEGK